MADIPGVPNATLRGVSFSEAAPRQGQEAAAESTAADQTGKRHLRTAARRAPPQRPERLPILARLVHPISARKPHPSLCDSTPVTRVLPGVKPVTPVSPVQPETVPGLRPPPGGAAGWGTLGGWAAAFWLLWHSNDGQSLTAPSLDNFGPYPRRDRPVTDSLGLRVYPEGETGENGATAEFVRLTPDGKDVVAVLGGVPVRRLTAMVWDGQKPHERVSFDWVKLARSYNLGALDEEALSRLDIPFERDKNWARPVIRFLPPGLELGDVPSIGRDADGKQVWDLVTVLNALFGLGPAGDDGPARFVLVPNSNAGSGTTPAGVWFPAPADQDGWPELPPALPEGLRDQDLWNAARYLARHQAALGAKPAPNPLELYRQLLGLPPEPQVEGGPASLSSAVPAARGEGPVQITSQTQRYELASLGGGPLKFKSWGDFVKQHPVISEDGSDKIVYADGPDHVIAVWRAETPRAAISEQNRYLDTLRRLKLGNQTLGDHIAIEPADVIINGTVWPAQRKLRVEWSADILKKGASDNANSDTIADVLAIRRILAANNASIYNFQAGIGKNGRVYLDDPGEVRVGNPDREAVNYANYVLTAFDAFAKENVLRGRGPRASGSPYQITSLSPRAGQPASIYRGQITSIAPERPVILNMAGRPPLTPPEAEMFLAYLTMLPADVLPRIGSPLSEMVLGRDFRRALDNTDHFAIYPGNDRDPGNPFSPRNPLPRQDNRRAVEQLAAAPASGRAGTFTASVPPSIVFVNRIPAHVLEKMGGELDVWNAFFLPGYPGSSPGAEGEQAGITGTVGDFLVGQTVAVRGLKNMDGDPVLVPGPWTRDTFAALLQPPREAFNSPSKLPNGNYGLHLIAPGYADVLDFMGQKVNEATIDTLAARLREDSAAGGAAAPRPETRKVPGILLVGTSPKAPFNLMAALRHAYEQERRKPALWRGEIPIAGIRVPLTGSALNEDLRRAVRIMDYAHGMVILHDAGPKLEDPALRELFERNPSAQFVVALDGAWAMQPHSFKAMEQILQHPNVSISLSGAALKSPDLRLDALADFVAKHRMRFLPGDNPPGSDGGQDRLALRQRRFLDALAQRDPDLPVRYVQNFRGKFETAIGYVSAWRREVASWLAGQGQPVVSRAADRSIPPWRYVWAPDPQDPAEGMWVLKQTRNLAPASD
jgi:hypothetical protein